MEFKKIELNMKTTQVSTCILSEAKEIKNEYYKYEIITHICVFVYVL